MTSYINNTLTRLIQNIKLKCGKRIKQAATCQSRSQKHPRQRFVDTVRQVIGGLPDVKYVMDMDIIFNLEDDPTPYDKTHIHQFTAKSPRLTAAIIQDAYQSFKKKFQHDSWYEDIDIIDHRLHSTVPFSETMLGDIQLLDHKRLPYKLCPDDVVVNKTPNECVIDGMLAFLRKWKCFDRDALIAELGSSSTNINQIKAWVEDNPQYDRYVSLYIVDPFLNCHYAHPAEPGSCKACLTFYVNDHISIQSLTTNCAVRCRSIIAFN
jgi:hypothetical protein